MKKYIIFSLLAFIVPVTVFGAVTWYNDTQSGVCGTKYGVECYMHIGQWTGATTTLDTSYLAIDRSGTNYCTLYYVILNQYDDNSYNHTYATVIFQDSWSSETFSSTEMYGSMSVATDPLLNGKYYEIQLGCSDGGASTDTNIVTAGTSPYIAHFGIADSVQNAIDAMNGSYVPDPAIAFVNPTTSSTVADFQNWQLLLTNIAPSSTYQVRVLYGESTSSIGTYMDVGGWFTSASTTVSSLVLKGNSLVPFSSYTTTTRRWYARPVLYSSSTSFVGTDIAFDVTRSPGTIPQPDWTASRTIAYASTTLQGPALDCSNLAVTTSSSWGVPWFAETAPARLMCEAKKFVIGTSAFLFQPDDSVTNYAISELTGYRQVFPFSLFFGTIEQFQSGFQNASSTGEGNYYLNFDIDNVTSSMKIGGPNIIVDEFGLPLVNQIFDFIILVFGGLVIFGMYQKFKP